MARVWPNDVPHEQNAEGAILPQTYRPPASSEVEAGPDRTRRRVGPRSTLIPWKSVPLTAGQWGRLEQFFREDLLEGTLSFDMPIFRADVDNYVTRRVQLEGGLWGTDQSNYPLLMVSFNLFVFNL